TARGEHVIEGGELVPVDVEGVRGKRLVLRDEVALLESPPEPPASVAFLPPFDPLVWDRPLLGSLFGFDYVLELFHPPAQRAGGGVGGGPRRGDRARVGGRLRAEARRGVRRRDARCARCLSAVRRSRADPVGTAP